MDEKFPEKFRVFVDWMRDEHTDLAYRYVFSAYCTSGGPWEKTVGHATLRVLERRYCRDVYPDMSAWERQQHEWYMEWP